jgi:hypothetical protein
MNVLFYLFFEPNNSLLHEQHHFDRFDYSIAYQFATFALSFVVDRTTGISFIGTAFTLTWRGAACATVE